MVEISEAGFRALAQLPLTDQALEADMSVMAISYSINAAARLVRFWYGSEVTLREWTDAMTKLEADPDLGPGFAVLVDRRQAEVPTRDFIDGVADYLKSHNEGLAIAQWATIVDVHAAFGMSSMVQTRLDELPFPFEIFTEESSALAWLFQVPD